MLTIYDIGAYDVHKPYFSILSLKLASRPRKGLAELHGEPYPGLYESLVSRDGVTLRDSLPDVGR
jgi:hypothetical protein